MKVETYIIVGIASSLIMYAEIFIPTFALSGTAYCVWYSTDFWFQQQSRFVDSEIKENNVQIADTCKYWSTNMIVEF